MEINLLTDLKKATKTTKANKQRPIYEIHIWRQKNSTAEYHLKSNVKHPSLDKERVGEYTQMQFLIQTFILTL